MKIMVKSIASGKSWFLAEFNLIFDANDVH